MRYSLSNHLHETESVGKTLVATLKSHWISGLIVFHLILPKSPFKFFEVLIIQIKGVHSSNQIQKAHNAQQQQYSSTTKCFNMNRFYLLTRIFRLSKPETVGTKVFGSNNDIVRIN